MALPASSDPRLIAAFLVLLVIFAAAISGFSSVLWLTVGGIGGAFLAQPAWQLLQRIYIFRNNTANARPTAEELRELAYTDDLTGLTNRASFLEKLEALCQSEDSLEFALLFIDLDGFKHVNDVYGHEAGDGLLRHIAQRLKGCNTTGLKLVARLGGDEFTAIIQADKLDATALAAAESLVEAVNEPLVLVGQSLRIGASVGIARYPQDATAPSALLRNADTAMYQAKANGRNSIRLFSRELEEHKRDYFRMVSDLQGAMERSEFQLHYQPKLDLQSGEVLGLEALFRWQHESRGNVPPSRVIPVAEESGLIIPLGEWVLEAACAQLARWRSQFNRPALTVAVNVSLRQLSSGALVDTVRHFLASACLPSDALEIEITETCAASDPEQAARILRVLRNMGVRISLDDFGTGYASLSYLRQLPIDTVKLDRSFISNVHKNARDRAIVAATAQIARQFNINVVAEGIEDPRQIAPLLELGIQCGQGFYFSKPLPAEKIPELLD
ncbi:putative bifunctional diguanylate cyclase/phosphodiesterase [Biformimicrobium ophioploci]|nr:EAL domain-containing protein [Microbulbifer sp. NKW57]